MPPFPWDKLMRTIYKYPIGLIGQTTINLPVDGRVVRVGLDPSGDCCVWVEMNLNDKTYPMHFCIVGTGHVIPIGFKHIGSFIDGEFIWHMYMNGSLVS